jgi:hypothetical protein
MRTWIQSFEKEAARKQVASRVGCGLTRRIPLLILVLVCLALSACRTQAASDTNVVFWGSNTYGQGTFPDELTNAVAAAAGAYYSLVLREESGPEGGRHRGDQRHGGVVGRQDRNAH